MGAGLTQPAVRARSDHGCLVYRIGEGRLLVVAKQDVPFDCSMTWAAALLDNVRPKW
jgi:hypothetical protein